jgi:hypothetical protein
MAGAKQFDRLFGPSGSALTGNALQARLALDVNATTTAIIIGFILLSRLIRAEGTRYGRVHAEMTLARDIHGRLVPPIARRLGTVDFRGMSQASGDVGRDLIDLVESPDVSGHGVVAGLLMGMVKSTARSQLLTGERLDGVIYLSCFAALGRPRLQCCQPCARMAASWTISQRVGKSSGGAACRGVSAGRPALCHAQANNRSRRGLRGLPTSTRLALVVSDPWDESRIQSKG